MIGSIETVFLFMNEASKLVFASKQPLVPGTGGSIEIIIIIIFFFGRKEKKTILLAAFCEV